MEELQNGKRKIQYLLGELSVEEQRLFDEQLFFNDDYFERLMATEDELIEDYLRDRLSPSERRQFELNFLSSKDLRKKVNLTKLLLNYIDAGAARTLQRSQISQHETRRRNYEDSIESQQFLRQGLGTYQTYLWISALFRSGVLGLFWLLLCFGLFTGIVEGRNIFLGFLLIAMYGLLEGINVRRSMHTAKLALSEQPIRKVTW